MDIPNIDFDKVTEDVMAKASIETVRLSDNDFALCGVWKTVCNSSIKNVKYLFLEKLKQ